MPSQDDQGISLFSAPTGTGYRLLELPPELVTLLESQNPPILKLESSPAAGLLRAPGGKVWSLRQMNTSNALILLGVHHPQGTSSSRSRQPGLPSAGLGVMATVHDTVELVPEASNAAAPKMAAKGKWHERFGRTR